MKHHSLNSGRPGMKYVALTLITTLLMAAGQMLFKIGSTGKDFSSLSNIVKLLFSPTILLALCIYGGTTILWMYILSKVEINRVYPIQSLAFALVLVLASVVFKERIPANRWVGVGIIIVGVIIATFR